MTRIRHEKFENSIGANILAIYFEQEDTEDFFKNILTLQTIRNSIRTVEDSLSSKKCSYKNNCI